MEPISSPRPAMQLVHLVQQLYQSPINPNVLQPVSSVTVVPLSSADEKPNVIRNVDNSKSSRHSSSSSVLTRSKTRRSSAHSITRGMTRRGGANTIQKHCNPKPKVRPSQAKATAKTKKSTSNCLKNDSTRCQEEPEVSQGESEHATTEDAEISVLLSSSGSVNGSAEYCLVTNDKGEYALLPASAIGSDIVSHCGDDFDEMWQLPDDICRICAKRSESIEHVFSDKSEKLGVVEMIHSHLPILVTPEDLLPLTVCRTCISSLQVADKLVKTCVAANDTLRILVEHVCKVSLPASTFVSFSSDSYGVSESVSSHQGDGGSSGDRVGEPSCVSSDLDKIEDHQGKKVLASNIDHNFNSKSIAQICQLNINALKDQPSSKIVSLEDHSSKEKIKSGGCKITLVKLPKHGNLPEKANHTKVMEILKKLNANPTLKKKGIKRLNISDLKSTLSRSATASSELKSSCVTVSPKDINSQNLLQFSLPTNAADIHKTVILGQGNDAEVNCDDGDDPEGSNPSYFSESNGFEGILSLELTENVSEPQLYPKSFDSETEAIQETGNVNANVSEAVQSEKTIAIQETGNVNENVTEVMQSEKEKRSQAVKLHKLNKQREKRRLARLSKPLSCCDCDFVAATKEELGEHKILHLKCRYCGKLQKARINLIEHERVHTKEKPFVCDKCGWRFRTKPQMVQHAQRHNPETPYGCNICGKKFSVKTTYTDHVQRHNEDSPYLCETCGKSFKLQAALRFHKFSHRTYMCSVCDKSFSYRAFQVHKRSHSGECYICSDCGKKFLSKEHLKNHMLIHEGLNPFKCGVCNRSFKRITHLQAHRHRHAGDLLLRLKFYVCAVCDESFNEAVGLSAHVRNHSKEEKLTTKGFRCPSCDKCFSEEHELRSHELLHVRTLSCGTCNESFNQREELEKHASDHFEDKPHACDVCGKRFGALTNLNSHKAVHQSVKSYLCELCVKSFKTLNGLNQHKMVHSDERNFSCPICELGFKRKNALKNHERTHFTERPYTCSVCARSFKVKSDCTTHLRRHRLSGLDGTVIESSYNCHLCPSTFTLKVDLSNHVHACHHHEVPESNLIDYDDSHLSEEACVSPEAMVL